jgi:hypothetical protein
MTKNPRKQARKEYLINQLARALTYHREHTPKITDRLYIRKLAIRFGLHPKTMETGIDLMARMKGN